jgi:hypothetical protein
VKIPWFSGFRKLNVDVNLMMIDHFNHLHLTTLFYLQPRIREITINTLSLFPGLLSAGGMGLWHGVEYYEKEKVVGEEFYQQWNNVSQNQTYA